MDALREVRAYDLAQKTVQFQKSVLWACIRKGLKDGKSTMCG